MIKYIIRGGKVKKMLRDPHKFGDVMAELKMGKEVSFLVNGWSMLPFFCHDKTLVTLKDEKVNVGDIVLYIDGKISMNRVIKILDNQYILQGDGQFRHSSSVCDEAILGKVIAFNHKNKDYAINDSKLQKKMKAWLLVKKIPGSRHYIRFLRKRCS